MSRRLVCTDPGCARPGMRRLTDEHGVEAWWCIWHPESVPPVVEVKPKRPARPVEVPARLVPAAAPDPDLVEKDFGPDVTPAATRPGVPVEEIVIPRLKRNISPEGRAKLVECGRRLGERNRALAQARRNAEGLAG